MRWPFTLASLTGALLVAASTSQTGLAASVEFTLATPTISKELVERLDAVVEKVDVTLETDTTIADFALARCGFPDPVFTALLIEANRGLQTDRASRVAAGTRLAVPPCGTRPSIERSETEVTPGDTGARLVRRSLGFDPGRFLTMGTCGENDAVWATGGCPRAMGLEVLAPAIAEAGTATGATATILRGSADRIFSELNASITDATRMQIGDTVVVPTVAPTVYTFPVRGDVDAGSAARALAEGEASLEAGSVATVEPYAPVATLPAGDPSNDCTPRRDEDWRSEAYDLIDVLAFERAMVDPGAEPPRPVVRLLDSGVHLERASPGWPTPFPATAIDTTIIDGIGDIADIGPMPLASRPYAVHGTQVAYVAIGGTALARILATQGVRISLRPFNIYPTEKRLAHDASGTVVEDFAVLDGANRINSILEALDGEIVNMSFGRANPMTNLRLSPISKALFVVAAGNSQSAGGEGNDIGILPVYPASSGGDDAPNLISVASIDGDDTLSRFSNRGMRNVDIAAPGCRIPTVLPTGAGYDRTEVSGTSFAAPQVTLAASLLRSLRSWSGARTKQRILAGADYEPTLSDRVRHGRVLDLAKTLSLSRDVVETAGDQGSPRERLFGRLTRRLTPADLCETAIPINQGRRLVKAVFGVRESDGALVADQASTLLVIADDGTGGMRSLGCRSRQANLDIIDSDDGSIRTLVTTSLREITFRDAN